MNIGQNYIVEGRSLQGKRRYVEIKRTGKNEVWVNITNRLGEERCILSGNFDEFVSKIKTVPCVLTKIADSNKVVIAGSSVGGRNATFEIYHVSDPKSEPQNFDPERNVWEDCGITIKNGGVVNGWGLDWSIYLVYADLIKVIS